MKLRDLLFLFLCPHVCFTDVIEAMSLETDEDLVVPSLYPLSSIRVSIPANYQSGMYAGWHLNYCSSCFSSISHIECKNVVRDEKGGANYSVKMERNEVKLEGEFEKLLVIENP